MGELILFIDEWAMARGPGQDYEIIEIDEVG